MSASKALMKAASGVSGEVLGVGDPWNISTAQWLAEDVNYFNPVESSGSSFHIFFKPDGLKLYVSTNGDSEVNEYNLSEAWDITTASYLQAFSVATQETGPKGMFFKPDGTKMYVVGTSNDSVYEYNLSTAWDVTSASHVQTFSVLSQDFAPRGVWFKTDGTKMYVSGATSASIHEYNLSTAWDISSASLLQSEDISTDTPAPRSLYIRSDGSKMYVANGGGHVSEYNLSTAWDVSSASHVQDLDTTGVATFTGGVFLKSDGSELYVIGGSIKLVSRYQLSTAWDISSASYQEPTTKYFSVESEELSPKSVFFKPDGKKMYVTGGSGDDVNEYDLSTAWNIHTASYSQNFSVAAQETSPQGLFFKPDGTKMYVNGFDNDTVNEYDLSTAWDISSASYSQQLDISGQNGVSTAIFFKPDGTKFYLLGRGPDAIDEYDLSTAWDITSASRLQEISVNSEESSPSGLFFKPDGTKMYVVGFSGDEVNEYDLSTAWDISSSSALQTFSIIGQSNSSEGIFFKPDGLKMYIVDQTEDAIFEYDL